jgi:hypothetical protein
MHSLNSSGWGGAGKIFIAALCLTGLQGEFSHVRMKSRVRLKNASWRKKG